MNFDGDESDLVITDIKMLQMNGILTMRRFEQLKTSPRKSIRSL